MTIHVIYWSIFFSLSSPPVVHWAGSNFSSITLKSIFCFATRLANLWLDLLGSFSHQVDAFCLIWYSLKGPTWQVAKGYLWTFCRKYSKCDSNLLKKGQSQYEAGQEENEEDKSEKETSPSGPAAAALKSDIDPCWPFYLILIFWHLKKIYLILDKINDGFTILLRHPTSRCREQGCITNPSSWHCWRLLCSVLLSLFVHPSFFRGICLHPHLFLLHFTLWLYSG